MNYRISVQITAPVNDTEIEERVAEAIRSIFPDAEIESSPGELMAHTHSLAHLSQRLHEQAILDTARSQFFAGQENSAFSFNIKKQAATEGYVTFAVGSPSELGDIHVRVSVDHPDVESVIDQIAPPTQDGVPIQDSSL